MKWMDQCLLRQRKKHAPKNTTNGSDLCLRRQRVKDTPKGSLDLCLCDKWEELLLTEFNVHMPGCLQQAPSYIIGNCRAILDYKIEKDKESNEGDTV